MADRIEGGLLRAVPAWIVMWIVIFKAERSDRRHLRDVFTGLRPMEMPGFAWKNDDASRRIGLHLVAIEGLPEPDVKNARHDRVDTILWMLVRHQFRAVRHLDPDHVRTGFRGMAYKDRQASPGRKRREWLPVDIFRENRFENGFAWLVGSNQRCPKSFASPAVWTDSTTEKALALKRGGRAL